MHPAATPGKPGVSAIMLPSTAVGVTALAPPALDTRIPSFTPMSAGALKKQGYVHNSNRDTGLENKCKRVKRDGMDWEGGIEIQTRLTLCMK